MNATRSDELPDEPLRVIFLDVDGVLHPNDTVPDSACGSGEDPGECLLASPGMFLPTCLDRLGRLVRASGAVIVLSSSWRCEPASAAEVVRQLAQHGLAVHGATPQGLTRGAEIAAWVSDRQDEIAALAVLDDQDLRHELGARNCVVVDGAAGLTDADVEKAEAMLKRRACERVADATLDSFRNAEAEHAAGWRPWKRDYVFSDDSDGEVDDSAEADRRSGKKDEKERRRTKKTTTPFSGEGEEDRKKRQKASKGKRAQTSPCPAGVEVAQARRFETEKSKTKKNKKMRDGDEVKAGAREHRCNKDRVAEAVC